MQQKIKENKFTILFLFGLFLFISSLGLILYKYCSAKEIILNETTGIDTFFEEQITMPNEEKKETSVLVKEKYDYIAVIDIPKIKLKRGLVSKDNEYNDVDKNIEILKDSSMPTEETGNFILASHSGNTRVSFFKNLYKLKTGDLVYIYYENKVYLYEINNIYEIEKTGKAIIKRNVDKKVLTMITCKKGTNMQLVVIAEIISEEEY